MNWNPVTGYHINTIIPCSVSSSVCNPSTTINKPGLCKVVYYYSAVINRRWGIIYCPGVRFCYHKMLLMRGMCQINGRGKQAAGAPKLYHNINIIS